MTIGSLVQAGVAGALCLLDRLSEVTAKLPKVVAMPH